MQPWMASFYNEVTCATKCDSTYECWSIANAFAKFLINVFTYSKLCWKTFQDVSNAKIRLRFRTFVEDVVADPNHGFSLLFVNVTHLL